jgi:hypothetical protein
MTTLADAERFEEAASARDRLHALAVGLSRSRVDSWLLGAGRLEVHDDDGRSFRFERGSLQATRGGVRDDPIGEPCPGDRAAELAVVRSWLVRHRPRIDGCDEPLAEPVDGGATLARMLERARLPSSDRRGTGGRRRGRRG